MGFLTSILGGGTEKIVTAVGSVLDNLFTSTDERNKADIAKTQIILVAEQAKAETAEKLEEAYLTESANLREQIKVEVQSADWFVRRSRPAAVWIGVVVLAFNLIVTPTVMSIASLFDHEVKVVPMPLPVEFWYVWTGLVLGYGVLRTYDKKKADTA